MPRKKQQRIFVYNCDYCNKQWEHRECGEEYIITAGKHRYCKPCHNIVVQNIFNQQAEEKKQLEEKRKRVYGRKQFTPQEQEQRKAAVSKLEEYLNYLKRGR